MNGLCARALAALLLLAASAATAAEGGLLETDSPFLPEAAAGASASAPAPLEFRGLLSMGGEHRFNIVDTSTRKGVWVGLNQAGDLRVVAYEKNGDTETVTVEQGGRSLRLELMRPRTGKAAPAAARPAGPAQQVQGPITPVVLNPTPADQAKALEDTIAEVRRRRLMRQQQAAGQLPPAAQDRPPPPPQGQP